MAFDPIVYLAAIFVGIAIFMAGCNNEVPRPDSTVCLNNVQDLRQRCYNLLRDYDDNGNLKKDAKPVIIQYTDPSAMLSALHKSFSTDPSGWANIKAYIQNLRNAGK